MKVFQMFSVIVGLLLSAFTANAYPALAGYTGTGVLPNAAITPVGQFQLAADFYSTDDSAIASDNTYPGRVLYGLVKDWEIGAGYTLSQIGGDDANTWNANIKYIVPIDVLGLTTSFGARYAQTDVNVTDSTDNTTSVYLVGSRRLFGSSPNTNVNGNIGVNWTQIDPEVGGSSHAFRGFAGLEAVLGKNLSLAGDIQTKDEDLETNALYSLVLRYGFSPSLMAQVGFTNADIVGVNGGDDSNLFAGVNFVFGRKATTQTTSTGGY